uniref:Uncharacterized protein n=1 Tax=Chromera velia CCMP2878 TaxID=1169474 RepID=A0A0G4HGL4_9ALVE|eukprot:Cvel_27240.t1-p1 / transcript=Cvel_27240.t1 / gene=Cvel_27240 / organism=Chromera_velia_CCMP2878 / gene_product=hypothetical protein / transcript_product=hypothetical protein / location=Cvel_scaffold3373:4317-7573(+) / protein_length=900 / sequence_SO=supercontig / SO=protein_coding / is_pseudo=false
MDALGSPPFSSPPLFDPDGVDAFRLFRRGRRGGAPTPPPELEGPAAFELLETSVPSDAGNKLGDHAVCEDIPIEQIHISVWIWIATTSLAICVWVWYAMTHGLFKWRWIRPYRIYNYDPLATSPLVSATTVLIYRFLNAMTAGGVLFYAAFAVNREANTPHMLGYYTVWNYVMLFIYFSLASFYSLAYSLVDSGFWHRLPQRLRMQGLFWDSVRNVIWVMFQQQAVAAPLLDFIFWGALWPSLPPKEQANMLSLVSCCEHMLNAVQMGGEFWLNRIPVHFNHGVFVLVIAELYLLFGVVYYGRLPSMPCDTRTTKASFSFTLVCGLHCVGWLLLYRIAQMKFRLIASSEKRREIAEAEESRAREKRRARERRKQRKALAALRDRERETDELEEGGDGATRTSPGSGWSGSEDEEGVTEEEGSASETGGGISESVEPRPLAITVSSAAAPRQPLWHSGSFVEDALRERQISAAAAEREVSASYGATSSGRPLLVERGETGQGDIEKGETAGGGEGDLRFPEGVGDGLGSLDGKERRGSGSSFSQQQQPHVPRPLRLEPSESAPHSQQPAAAPGRGGKEQRSSLASLLLPLGPLRASSVPVPVRVDELLENVRVPLRELAGFTQDMIVPAPSIPPDSHHHSHHHHHGGGAHGHGGHQQGRSTLHQHGHRTKHRYLKRRYSAQNAYYQRAFAAAGGGRLLPPVTVQARERGGLHGDADGIGGGGCSDIHQGAASPVPPFSPLMEVASATDASPPAAAGSGPASRFSQSGLEGHRPSFGIRPMDQGGASGRVRTVSDIPGFVAAAPESSPLRDEERLERQTDEQGEGRSGGIAAMSPPQRVETAPEESVAIHPGPPVSVSREAEGKPEKESGGPDVSSVPDASPSPSPSPPLAEGQKEGEGEGG